MTPFMAACGSGDHETVQLLLDNASNIDINLNAKMSDGTTAFMIACKNGYSKIVETLLKFGIDREISLDQKDSRGFTGYMLAADTSKINYRFKKQ